VGGPVRTCTALNIPLKSFQYTWDHQRKLNEKCKNSQKNQNYTSNILSPTYRSGLCLEFSFLKVHVKIRTGAKILKSIQRKQR